MLTPRELLSSGGSVEGRLALNGTGLYFRGFGRGDPLVLVHGGPGLDHQHFLPHIYPLSANRRTLLYDQRGCGASESPPPETPCGFEEHVEDLQSFLRGLDYGPVDLMGSSFGVLVVLATALKEPDLCRNLLLVCPGAVHGPGWHREFVKELHTRLSKETRLDMHALEMKWTPEKADAVGREMFRLSLPGFFNRPELAITVNPGSYTDRVYRDTWRSLGTYDLRPRLRNLNHRTLVIQGLADPIPSWTAEEIAEIITGARLVRFSASGHFPFVEEPARFLEVVEGFLAGSYEVDSSGVDPASVPPSDSKVDSSRKA